MVPEGIGPEGIGPDDMDGLPRPRDLREPRERDDGLRSGLDPEQNHSWRDHYFDEASLLFLSSLAIQLPKIRGLQGDFTLAPN